MEFTYNVGIGSNFAVLTGYYMASPVNLILYLVPERSLMEYIAVVIWLKISLCGFTSYYYFENKSEKNGFFALFFSLFYAFSGYMAAYYYNIMWLDSIVLAPIIVLGLEKLIKEGKTTCYLWSLALALFSNFYIGYMICLYLVLYSIYLFFTEGRPWRRIWTFVWASLAAGGLAAVRLIPDGIGFHENKVPNCHKILFPGLGCAGKTLHGSYSRAGIGSLAQYLLWGGSFSFAYSLLF